MRVQSSNETAVTIAIIITYGWAIDMQRAYVAI